ncbi:hypothetical protein Tco_0708911, partial [Tanacetum coccineum]
KTSHAVSANLFELELKKILIDKMKSNKSIDRSDEQKNLYKVLVDVYEADKALLETYGDTSAGQFALTEVPMHTADDFEDPTHQEFDTELNDDQPEEEAHPHPDWF